MGCSYRQDYPPVLELDIGLRSRIALWLDDLMWAAKDRKGRKGRGLAIYLPGILEVSGSVDRLAVLGQGAFRWRVCHSGRRHR